MSSNVTVLRQELNSLELGKHWYWFFIAGLVMLIGGVLALFNPFAASITVELIAGWTFILAGIINIFQVFTVKGTSTKIWTVTLGILALLLGISLLNNPLAGLMSLTLVVGILIAISGVTKVIYGFKVRPNEGWIWLLVSGIISIILAGLIFTNLTGAGLMTLGVILAIELISSGTLLILVSFALKKLTKI